MNITLNFTTDEVNSILMALSALPTGHNVWPLAMRIKQEAEAQVPAPEASNDAVAEVVPAE
jgi:hypothetical protein